MPATAAQVGAVRDGLTRWINIHQKILRLNALNKLEIDENEDLEITNAQQLANYIAVLENRKDNIIAAVKPVVAGW